MPKTPEPRGHAEKRTTTDRKSGRKTAYFGARYLVPGGRYLRIPEKKFKTRKDAERAAIAASSKALTATTWADPRKGQTPLGEWAISWLKHSTTNPATLDRRWYLLEYLLLPEFANEPLVTTNHWPRVKAWTARCPYSYKTVGDALTLLSTILTAAEDEEMIGINKIRGRRRAPCSVKPDEKIMPTPDEVIRMIERCRSTADRLMILTAMFCGLRWGELAGLHRDNCLLERRDRIDGKIVKRHVLLIDPEVGTYKEIPTRVEVDPDEPESAEQLARRRPRSSIATPALRTRTTYRMGFGPPKPPNGAREVDVPPFLVDLLRDHLATWPHPYVFCGKRRGTLWRRSNWGRQVLRPIADGKLCRRLEHYPKHRAKHWEPIIPGMTMHGFKHWLKSIMQQGDERGAIPKVLQCQILGHEYKKNAGMDGVYTEVLPEMRVRLSNLLQRHWETGLRIVANERVPADAAALPEAAPPGEILPRFSHRFVARPGSRVRRVRVAHAKDVENAA